MQAALIASLVLNVVAVLFIWRFVILIRAYQSALRVEKAKRFELIIGLGTFVAIRALCNFFAK